MVKKILVTLFLTIVGAGVLFLLALIVVVNREDYHLRHSAIDWNPQTHKCDVRDLHRDYANYSMHESWCHDTFCDTHDCDKY